MYFSPAFFTTGVTTLKEELLGAWTEIEDDKNSKKTMADSQNEIIENSKQIRKNNIKLQDDLKSTIKNAQENYDCAIAKEQECKNLSSKNEKGNRFIFTRLFLSVERIRPCTGSLLYGDIRHGYMVLVRSLVYILERTEYHFIVLR